MLCTTHNKLNICTGIQQTKQHISYFPKAETILKNRTELRPTVYA